MALPVHPHVRGAHVPVWRRSTAACGPSPRAWGSLVDDPVQRAAVWSIPTCVGLTAPPRRTRSARGPSPRAWGSPKLTCNFARRYLLVIWIVGSFAIHDTLNRFPEHRPLNGAMRAVGGFEPHHMALRSHRQPEL